MTRAAALAWVAYAVCGGTLAAYALVAWLGAIALRGPVLYGEGAVAHAALLLRDGLAYRNAGGAEFVAANYPPLYFAIASLGDPFVSGRIASVAATLAIAFFVARGAWRAGPLAAGALTLGWLALAPVAIWGPALKPDLVALALTVFAVTQLDASPRRARLAGVLVVLAALAKPTALLPGAALAVWLLATDRAALARYSLGVLGGALGAAALAVAFGVEDVMRHVLLWNALDWSANQMLLLAVLGLATLGTALGAAIWLRAWRGATAAYAAGALAIVALGGREGATINYLLDVSAAASLALAGAAVRLRATPAYPVAATLALIVATALLNPLQVLPGRAPTTGAWGDPARVAALRSELAPGATLLVEDAGLLLANGARPVVDDLFLWSRLASRGAIDPRPVLDAVRRGAYAAVVSEVDLARLDEAPAYERARWLGELAEAVRQRYRLASDAGGLFTYRPR